MKNNMLEVGDIIYIVDADTVGVGIVNTIDNGRAYIFPNPDVNKNYWLNVNRSDPAASARVRVLSTEEAVMARLEGKLSTEFVYEKAGR